MILYILLLLLFFAVLVLGAVDQKRMSKRIRKQLEDMNDLNEWWTQRELWEQRNLKQTEEDLKLINHTSGLLNSIQQEQYDEYRKRGGTDSETTWLQKSEIHELFP